MKPDFKVLADSVDVTNLIRDRLLSLTVIDKPGIDADTCVIELDDRDGKVKFPRKGALLEVSLGYVGQPLTGLGSYKVDEIEIKGPPATLVISCKAADIRQDSKTHRDGSWEGVPLATIVGEIAGRHGWQPVCQVNASVERADQRGESDLHFITRLARQYNATATVKKGQLLVLPRGQGRNASGQSMGELIIQPDHCASYTVKFPDRPSHGKVKTKWHDAKTGQPVELEIPVPEAPAGATATHVDRHTYANAAAAQAAADSHAAALNRATASGSLILERGDARFCAERKVHLKGFKPDVDGVFLADLVEHRYSHAGWITTVEFNAGNGGKAKVGQQQTNLTIPSPPQ